MEDKKKKKLIKKAEKKIKKVYGNNKKSNKKIGKKLHYGDKKEVAAAQKYFRDLSTPLAPSTMKKPITLKYK